MSKDRVVDSLGRIDDDMILGVDALRQKKKRPMWKKWGAIAACLCMVVAGTIAYQSRVPQLPSDGTLDNIENYDATADHRGEDSTVYGFTLTGNDASVYFPISFDERKEYGLVSEEAVGLDKDNTYRITPKDLGEQMGTVISCGDKSLIGCEVYHFATYPDKESICIVNTPSGYAFYVCNDLYIENIEGNDFETVLSAYGLPASLEHMKVQTSDLQTLFEVTDKAVIDSIFNLISSKVNDGREANEQRFAQAWYDAYGNDDVYYSEEVGHCVYRSASSEPATTYTDDAGNTTVQTSTQGISLYDKAHELWNKDERVIEITTSAGYQLVIDYFPSIHSFICSDGYYALTEEESKMLTMLLQIPE